MKHSLAVMLLLIIAAAVLAKLLVFELPGVNDDHMAPALQAGDRLLANRLKVKPTRGQLVLIKRPGSQRLMIRRVVGLPGERVAVIKEVLQVDGQPALRTVVGQVVLSGRGEAQKMRLVQERLGLVSYRVLKDPGRRSVDFAEVTLEGSYFVLADSRNHGADSRDFGPVSVDRIQAVITHRLMAGKGSVEGQGPRPGWERFKW